MPPVSANEYSSACVIEEDNDIFSLREPGTSSKATVDVSPRKCQKIQVDGCLAEIQPVRCDWCIRDKSNGECLFVELKGSDCKHAAEQIINTIRWFKSNTNPFSLHKKAYIVASGKIPSDKSKDKIIIANLANKAGINLRIMRSPADIKF